MFPDKFNSVYEQVSFTNNDYSIAWNRQKAQDVLMQNILQLEEFNEIPFSEAALKKLDVLLEEYQKQVEV